MVKDFVERPSGITQLFPINWEIILEERRRKEERVEIRGGAIVMVIVINYIIISFS